MIGAWLIAVPIFALFPVAPPRLAGIGIADTVSRQAAVALTGHSTIFYDPYAAVPSLHVGLAFAIGTAGNAALRAWWARAAALLWGPLVTVAVIATGNHYLFDVGAGLLVTGLAYAAGRYVPDLKPRVGLRARRPGVRADRRGRASRYAQRGTGNSGARTDDRPTPTVEHSHR